MKQLCHIRRNWLHMQSLLTIASTVSIHHVLFVWYGYAFCCLVFNEVIAHFGLLLRTNNIYRLDCCKIGRRVVQQSGDVPNMLTNWHFSIFTTYFAGESLDCVRMSIEDHDSEKPR